MTRAIKTLTISMPESLRLWVEDKAFRGNYGSVSEYIRELVRLDQRKESALIDAYDERNKRVVADDDLLRVLGLDG